MGSKKILLIKPLNRVEGDLEVKVEIKNGKVIDAYSSGVLFRGFERLLLRRDPMDAIVFTCRVCGICSISHSTASSLALRNAYGAKMPANAYFIRNIALATEVLLNHLTHLYAFFLIDFTNKKYSEKENYLEILNRFVFMKGSSYIKAMQARKNFLAFLGLFVGKWPNTLALQPGGVTKPVNASEIIRAKGILSEFKDFIENDLFGCKIECFLDNKTQTDLNKWLEDNHHARSDLGIFIKFARDIGLENLGKGPDAFLCCASYEMSDGLTFYKSGYFDNTNKPFDEEKITESIKYSYFEGYQDGRHPASGITNPDADKKGAYSWVKSPRYNREVVEVGPLARLVINNNSLARNLWHDSGANAYTRSIIRIYEMLVLLKKIEEWLEQISPEEPVYFPHDKKKDAQGTGFVEAPRGILGHWVNIKNSKIISYQIITPTAWNMSPRDAQDRPGAVEMALIGTPVEDEKNPVEIGHVIRSFDPCLFCSVH